MAPFGTGNMKAVFVTENLIAKSYHILKGKHLKLYVQQQGYPYVLAAIGFGLAHYEAFLRTQKPFKMAYTVEENTYLGERNLQLHIKDLQAM